MARSAWAISASRSAACCLPGRRALQDEVTRQLAIALGIEFIRFDMSEYMERHTVSRLIGALPAMSASTRAGC